MKRKAMTDEEIVAKANALARTFYKAHGYEVGEDYLFYEATHPQEQGMWNLACIAMQELTDTDAEEALANIEE